jgi:hypothetical protein
MFIYFSETSTFYRNDIAMRNKIQIHFGVLLSKSNEKVASKPMQELTEELMHRNK